MIGSETHANEEKSVWIIICIYIYCHILYLITETLFSFYEYRRNYIFKSGRTRVMKRSAHQSDSICQTLTFVPTTVSTWQPFTYLHPSRSLSPRNKYQRLVYNPSVILQSCKIIDAFSYCVTKNNTPPVLSCYMCHSYWISKVTASPTLSNII